jgi:hypothetical protein
MKRSVLSLLMLVFLSGLFAQQPTGTLVTAPIRPNDLMDLYPTAFANEIKGGHHTVPDTNARNAIYAARRDTGMFCTVLDDGSGNAKTFQLIGGLSNTHWVEFSSGSGGSSTMPVMGTGLLYSSNKDTVFVQYSSALWNANALQGYGISTSTPTDKQILVWNSITSLWEPADQISYFAGTGLSLSGNTFEALNTTAMWNADQLQGKNISTATPSNGQAIVWNSSASQFEFDSITGANDSFDGSKNITRDGLPASGTSMNTTTVVDFLNAYFFPSQVPVCNITGSGSSTLEYKSTSSAAITVNLNFSVVRQSATENIATASVSSNQSITGFPYNFFTAPGSNNQSGSLSSVSLVDNVSNTFTVTGTTTDGKSCGSSISYNFSHKRYWGSFASTVPPTDPAFNISDSQIIVLNGAGIGTGNEFASSREKIYNGINANGNYLVFAFPSSWGNPVFIINGLTSTAFTRVRNNTFVNQSAYSETYQVWLSNTTYNSPVSQFQIQ